MQTCKWHIKQFLNFKVIKFIFVVKIYSINLHGGYHNLFHNRFIWALIK